MIDSFSFGRMSIDGRSFTSDLMIFPDGRVEDGWWRKQGHRLKKSDLERLVAASPEIIIAGCGVHGMMRPDPELAGWLKDEGIDFFAASNAEAVKKFNASRTHRPSAACFHLTC